MEILDTSKPIHQKFEEEKTSYNKPGSNKTSSEKKKKKKYDMDDEEEEDLVNEIDNFLIEDGDL